MRAVQMRSELRKSKSKKMLQQEPFQQLGNMPSPNNIKLKPVILVKKHRIQAPPIERNMERVDIQR